MADEVTDVSGWEQLGLALCYIKDNVAVEKVIEYIACKNVTGNDICMYIMRTLQRLGLDPKASKLMMELEPWLGI